ncbi:MAG TPA: hypothetical protein VFR22_11390 [Nocardioidaceae bacterium]|nr:hypothetical protein [Nocardioidaceae bacterium]
MADNWQDACEMLASNLSDDEAQVQQTTQRMMEKTPAAILDGLGGVAMTLLLKLAETRGGRGADGQVDVERRRQIAIEVVQELRVNPPPGY